MVTRKKGQILSFTRFTLVATSALVVGASCGKKSSDDDSAPSSAVAANALAVAYPSSLNISAFPNSATASLMLAADEKPKATDSKTETAAAEKRLKGESDNCLPPIFKEAESSYAVTCYEFDQEMIYGTNPSGNTYGTLDGTDGNGEACLVAFARSQVKKIGNAVKRGLGMMEASLCQRKKEGATDLPAAGASVDLKSALTTGMSSGAVTVSMTSAALSRRAADAESRPVYDFVVKDLVLPNGMTVSVYVTHSPLADDNSKYAGTMYIKEKSSSASLALGGGGAADSSKTTLMSIRYVRDVDSAGAPVIRYETRRGQFANALVSSAIDANGILDFNAGATFTGSESSNTYGAYSGYSQANDAVSGMTYIAFTGNPEKDTGVFSYWQNPGGNYNERARGMIASLEDSNGTMTGCAYSGAAGTTSAGTSIRKALKTLDGSLLTPNGAYHPFFTTENATNLTGPTTDSAKSRDYYTASWQSNTIRWYKIAATGTAASAFYTQQQPNYHTKQCFSRNASGVYTITTTGTDGFELVDAANPGTNKLEPPKQDGAKTFAKPE